PSPVVPMPHPYVGVLLRPQDFIAAAVSSFIPPPPTAEMNSGLEIPLCSVELKDLYDMTPDQYKAYCMRKYEEADNVIRQKVIAGLNKLPVG
ncbi:hypothetical protein PZH42_30580, partial [Bacteroides cellulosilyticus]